MPSGPIQWTRVNSTPTPAPVAKPLPVPVPSVRRAGTNHTESARAGKNDPAERFRSLISAAEWAGLVRIRPGPSELAVGACTASSWVPNRIEPFDGALTGLPFLELRRGCSIPRGGKPDREGTAGPPIAWARDLVAQKKKKKKKRPATERPALHSDSAQNGLRLGAGRDRRPGAPQGPHAEDAPVSFSQKRQNKKPGKRQTRKAELHVGKEIEIRSVLNEVSACGALRRQAGDHGPAPARPSARSALASAGRSVAGAQITARR